jgi:SAM-dependent methyltransferase
MGDSVVNSETRANHETTSQSAEVKPRVFDRGAFDRAYRELVLTGRFFEANDYYRGNWSRYRRTFELLSSLPLPSPARVLEVGGGQMALLSRYLYGDICTVGDVNEEFNATLLERGVEFHRCDLIRDDLPFDNAFDVVVLLEVVEHIPLPLHQVLERVRRWIKPGGYLFITTPNLYRLRNVIRLALGLRVFDFFFVPEASKSIGHPFEYFTEHLRFHLERAGFEVRSIDLKQLHGFQSGATIATKLGRLAATPLFVNPRWRDSLVAIATKPRVPGELLDDAG